MASSVVLVLMFLMVGQLMIVGEAFWFDMCRGRCVAGREECRRILYNYRCVSRGYRPTFAPATRRKGTVRSSKSWSKKKSGSTLCTSFFRSACLGRKRK